jgi:hypothetical protein
MAASLRDQIMDALLAQLQASCGDTFAYYSRKFIMWQDLAQMLTNPHGDPRQLPRSPALFLYDGVGFGGGRDTWVQGNRGSPSKRTLHRTIVLYTWRDGGLTPTGPDASVGATSMWPLLESVENAIDPEPHNLSGMDMAVGSTTLNGLVTYCWIEGDGHCIPGDIDPSGLEMQTIPIKILIP